MKVVENSIKPGSPTILTFLKRLASIIAIGLLGCISASAYDFEYNGICYNVVSKTNKTARVTYRSEGNADGYVSGDIVIPSTVPYSGSEYTVIGIGMNSFQNCTKLTSVTIPNTVISVSSYVFDKCIALTSVEIPESVLLISNYVFRDCAALTAVTIPNSVTKIGKRAFYGCTALKSITIPGAVTDIGDEAFRGSGLEKLTIAFGESNLNIAEDAFAEAPIETLYIDRNWEGSISTRLKSVTIGNKVTELPKYAFYNCSALTSITIQNSITKISECAFCYCTGLTSITIPNSVTTIGEYAFGDCTGLTSVAIPNSVTTIGEYAFTHCTGLTSITIPNSVTAIGGHAFEYCTGLTSVTIPGSVSLLGDIVFYLCNNIENFNVDPDNNAYAAVDGVLYTKDLTKLIQYPLGNNRTEFTIPNTVITIGELAFEKCSNLTSINIPNSVITIGDCAFRGCRLTSITIPNSVITIGEIAFYNCNGLTSVTIPSSVTKIGRHAFSKCINLKEINVDLGNQYYASSDGVLYTKDMTQLEIYPMGSERTSFTIPNTVTTICYAAFRYCPTLKSVTIPNSVTTIDYVAFQDCTGLTSIYCQAATPPTAVSYAFDSITSVATLYVPNGSKTAYQNAEEWSKFENIVEIDMTGVDDVIGDSSDITVTVVNGEICISGADTSMPMPMVEVYATNGACVYRGSDTHIGNLAQGVYVVRVGFKTTKVVL